MTLWRKTLLALLLALQLLPITPALSASQPPPIVIGAIYNLTGPQSTLDIYSTRGAMLAAAMINARGGILGRQIELVIKDGKTRLQGVKDAAQSLANEAKVVAVIGLSDSALALAAIPSLAASNKIFITSGATSPTLCKAAPGLVFLASFPDNEQAYTAAAFAIRQLQNNSALLITQDDNRFIQSLGQSFKESYTKLGGNIAGDVHFSTQNLDLSSQLQTLLSNNVVPDVIYLAADSQTNLQIIQQIRKKGFNQPIISSDILDSSSLEKLPKLVGTIYFTTHAFIDPHNPNPRVQRFMTIYQQAWHQAPDSSFAALGYDAVHLLAEAINQAKSTDPKRISAALLQIRNFPGISGTINYSNSPIPDKSITLLQFQNGQRSIAVEY